MHWVSDCDRAQRLIDDGVVSVIPYGIVSLHALAQSDIPRIAQRA